MIRNQETIIRLLQNNKEHDPINEATPHTNQEFPNLASYGMPFKTLLNGYDSGYPMDIHVEGQIDQQGISHGYPLSYL